MSTKESGTKWVFYLQLTVAWNDFPNLKYLNLYLFGAWSHTTVDKSLFFCRQPHSQPRFVNRGPRKMLSPFCMFKLCIYCVFCVLIRSNFLVNSYFQCHILFEFVCCGRCETEQKVMETTTPSEISKYFNISAVKTECLESVS